jgi:FHS family L-fucose permease-like MFS transporter
MKTLIAITVILIAVFVYFSRYEDQSLSSLRITKRLLRTWLDRFNIVNCCTWIIIANTRAQKNAEGWGAMKYPQLVLGMLALLPM